MTSILTRPARRDDLPAMAAILNPIIRAGGTTALEDALSIEELGAKLFDNTSVLCAFVALNAGDGVAAFQWVRRYDPPDDPIGSIGSFARLTPRLPGAGRAMFATTCAACRAAGLIAIDATIRAENAPGLGYYTAIGFHDHTVHRGVPLKDGTPMDRIVKRFTL